MKKLAKINLLGDVSLLSKDELKRFVGAASDGCKVNGYSCEGGACVTDGQGMWQSLCNYDYEYEISEWEVNRYEV